MTSKAWDGLYCYDALGMAGGRGPSRTAGNCQDSQAPLATRHLDIAWGRSTPQSKLVNHLHLFEATNKTAPLYDPSDDDHMLRRIPV